MISPEVPGVPFVFILIFSLIFLNSSVIYWVSLSSIILFLFRLVIIVARRCCDTACPFSYIPRMRSSLIYSVSLYASILLKHFTLFFGPSSEEFILTYRVSLFAFILVRYFTLIFFPSSEEVIRTHRVSLFAFV